jgi:hypothetical protein
MDMRTLVHAHYDRLPSNTAQYGRDLVLFMLTLALGVALVDGITEIAVRLAGIR